MGMNDRFVEEQIQSIRRKRGLNPMQSALRHLVAEEDLRVLLAAALEHGHRIGYEQGYVAGRDS
jgi:hypothetical protein